MQGLDIISKRVLTDRINGYFPQAIVMVGRQPFDFKDDLVTSHLLRYSGTASKPRGIEQTVIIENL